MVARNPPRVDAAVEDAQVGVAELPQHLLCALGEPVVRIAENDACREPRHQGSHAQLDLAERQQAREQDVGLRVVVLLAHVEQRDLTAAVQQPRDLGGIDAAGRRLSTGVARVVISPADSIRPHEC